MTMTPTDHERAEWLRCSQDCAKHKRADASRFFARLAASSGTIPIGTYDRAMRYYRGWLTAGFPTEAR